ncbi:MAG: hypothetical protein WBB28_02655, partial [Crinalium sp.]
LGSFMKVWIASFVVLFAIAEFYQWLLHFTLPLPIYILGGAFLAIASNYDRSSGFPFLKSDEQPTTIPNPIDLTSGMPTVNSSTNPQINQSNFNPASPPSRPVSFTIRKDNQQSQQS